MYNAQLVRKPLELVTQTQLVNTPRELAKKLLGKGLLRLVKNGAGAKQCYWS